LSARCCWRVTLSLGGDYRNSEDYGVWFVFAAPWFSSSSGVDCGTIARPSIFRKRSGNGAGYMTEYSGSAGALYFWRSTRTWSWWRSLPRTLFLAAGCGTFAERRHSTSWMVSVVNHARGCGYCFYRAPKQPVEKYKKCVLGLRKPYFILVAEFWPTPIIAPPGSIVASAKPACTARFCVPA